MEQELLLTIDTVGLEARALEVSGFAQLPVARQLPLISPWTTEDDVLAVGWLDPLSADPLRMHLVLADEGRTVLRVVEASPGPQAVATLALAVREVLTLVIASRERVANQAPQPEAAEPDEVLTETEPPKSPTWSVHVLPGLGLRSSGSIGNVHLAQLQAGVALRLRGRLSLAFDALLLRGGGPDAATTETSFGGGLQLRWLPGSGKVGAGPLFSVMFVGTRLALSDQSDLVVEHFDLRFGPGFGFRLAPLPQFSLLLQAGVDIQPRLWEARLRSNGEPLHVSSIAQARISLGVEIALPRGPLAGGPPN